VRILSSVMLRNGRPATRLAPDGRAGEAVEKSEADPTRDLIPTQTPPTASGFPHLPPKHFFEPVAILRLLFADPRGGCSAELLHLRLPGRRTAEVLVGHPRQHPVRRPARRGAAPRPPTCRWISPRLVDVLVGGASGLWWRWGGSGRGKEEERGGGAVASGGRGRRGGGRRRQEDGAPSGRLWEDGRRRWSSGRRLWEDGRRRWSSGRSVVPRCRRRCLLQLPPPSDS
jgi:hypothetical protein